MIQKRPTRMKDEEEFSHKYGSLVTPFALSYIEKQIDKMQDYQFSKIEEGSAHTAKDGHYVYTVKDSCNCIFFQTMLLPCKHILKFRQEKRIDLFDNTLCHKRWLRETIANVLECTTATVFRKQAGEMKEKNSEKSSTKFEKVDKLTQLFEQIATEMIGLPEHRFEFVLNQYKKTYQILSNGLNFKVAQMFGDETNEDNCNVSRPTSSSAPSESEMDSTDAIHTGNDNNSTNSNDCVQISSFENINIGSPNNTLPNMSEEGVNIVYSQISSSLQLIVFSTIHCR